MKISLYPGIEYELPKQPAKDKILFHDRKKKDQKWNREIRVPLPAKLVGATRFESDELYKTDPEVKKFIDEDDIRCEKGIWFFNNGEPTYITGDHYFYLQWFNLDVGYPFYFDKDRRAFYFDDFCDTDPECMGSLYMKKRRDGFSYRKMSRVLNDAIRSINCNYGMMSKTGEDAKELFSKVVYAYRNLPAFKKPQVQSAEDVKKELFFSEPIQKVTHKTRTVKQSRSLNTKINWKNTKENSYDGTKQKKLIGDEVGKFEEASFEKWFAVAKTCLTQGRRIIGKGEFGSTVNESEKGGDIFKEVWGMSDYRQRDSDGRTSSGLFRYFTPASDGYEGFIDEYGMSVIETPEKAVMGIDGYLIKEGARPYLERKAKAYKDSGNSVGYYEHKRQFPLTEEDAFLDAANEKTSFNLDKIYEQIDHNNTVFVTSPGLLRKGNFVWRNGVRDTEVEWIDDINGKWLVAWFPPVAERNKKTKKEGMVAPGNTHEGIFSIDPFDHKQTTAPSKRSKAASHGGHKFSISIPTWSEMPVSEYWGRPQDPDILFEDMILQCVFYGWEILGESNKPGCINYFRRRGYDKYLSERPAFTHTDYSEKNQTEAWLPTSGEAVRRTLIEHTESYVYQNVGRGETGIYSNFLFNNTLADLAKFDPEKWTDFDLSVSFMLLVVGMKKYTPMARKTSLSISSFFKRYDTSGTESVEIKQRPYLE